MFDWNRGLMEDDWNDGQQYVFKMKNKSASGQEFGTTLKVGEAKSGAHKVAFEEKMKCKVSEFGGWETECKFKSSGDVDYKMEMNFPKT